MSCLSLLAHIYLSSRTRALTLHFNHCFPKSRQLVCLLGQTRGIEKKGQTALEPFVYEYRRILFGHHLHIAIALSPLALAPL